MTQRIPTIYVRVKPPDSVCRRTRSDNTVLVVRRQFHINLSMSTCHQLNSPQKIHQRRLLHKYVCMKLVGCLTMSIYALRAKTSQCEKLQNRASSLLQSKKHKSTGAVSEWSVVQSFCNSSVGNATQHCRSPQ